MIAFVQGKPGAGKSNWMIVQMLKWVQRGRRVITNMPLKESGWMRVAPSGWQLIVQVPQDVTGDGLHPLQDGVWLKEACEWRGMVLTDTGEPTMMGPVFFIDECHLVYPNGVNRALKGAMDFWTLHRHHGVDAYIATQQPGQTRSQLLQLCAEHWILIQNSVAGLGRGYRWFRHDGYNGALLDKRVFNQWSKLAFTLYHSTIGGTVAPGKKGRSILTRWQVLLPLGCVLYWLWGVPGQMRAWETATGTPKAVSAPAPAAPALAAAPVAVPQTPRPTVPGLGTPLVEVAAKLAAAQVGGAPVDAKVEAPAAPERWEIAALMRGCRVRWKRGNLRADSDMLTFQGWRIDTWLDATGRCVLQARDKDGIVAIAERW